jgi:branched-chain amino acid transport system permease protein
VIEVVQQLVDGLGRGSTYALLALGLAVVFGVLHLLNFAHGELITICAYTVYALSNLGLSWWLLAPICIVVATLSSMAMEAVAFRRVRNASPFTLLLTSFGVAILIQGFFQIVVSPKSRKYDKPSWVFDTWTIGSIRLEVADVLTIAVTVVVLLIVLFVVRRTMFGIALRGAATDFDATRLMGLRANRAISGAFALSGALAGVAAVLILMRRGDASPEMGTDYVLKAIVAAIIGGLGSMVGAVVGGLVLGIAEVAFRAWLPDSITGLTDGFVFAAIAVLLVVRPNGIFNVQAAERV